MSVQNFFENDSQVAFQDDNMTLDVQINEQFSPNDILQITDFNNINSPENEVKITPQEKGEVDSTSKPEKRICETYSDDLKEKFIHLVYVKNIVPARAAKELGVKRRTAYHWTERIKEHGMDSILSRSKSKYNSDNQTNSWNVQIYQQNYSEVTSIDENLAAIIVARQVALNWALKLAEDKSKITPGSKKQGVCTKTTDVLNEPIFDQVNINGVAPCESNCLLKNDSQISENKIELFSQSKNGKRICKKYPDSLKEQLRFLVHEKNVIPSKAAVKLGVTRKTAYRWSKENVDQGKSNSSITPILGSSRQKKYDDSIKEQFFRLMFEENMKHKVLAEKLGINRRTARRWAKGTTEEMYKSSLKSKEEMRSNKKHSETEKELFFYLIYVKKMTTPEAAKKVDIPRRTAYNWAQSVNQEEYKTSKYSKENQTSPKTFPVLLKEHFLRLIHERKIQIPKAADELGIPHQTAQRWVRMISKKGKDSFLSCSKTEKEITENLVELCN